MTRAGHLARRFVSSLSRRQPSGVEVAWAESQLLPPEAELWRRLSVADRRHSIIVAHRFAEFSSAPPSRDEIAGALLHDIGKVDTRLGTYQRVVATVVGPRTDRFRRYHDHERIGADMLRAAGSSDVTVQLVLGDGPGASALRQADDI